MKLIKQRPTNDGTTAMDCGVCVIAMLTDLPYEKVLADRPNYKVLSDFDWMRYLNLLGFELTQVDENSPPLGHRLYCGIDATAMVETKSLTLSRWTRTAEFLTPQTALPNQAESHSPSLSHTALSESIAVS